jgi:hypothetical protein
MNNNEHVNCCKDLVEGASRRALHYGEKRLKLRDVCFLAVVVLLSMPSSQTL